MTHPTKAIYKWLLSDYVKVSNVSVDDQLYDETDLLRSYEKIEAIDYHQTVELDGIRFTSYNAGHVLGAAMFLIEIAGVKILYTGDYSREEDRHLMAAETPPNNTQIDVLICESTYGVQSHEPRLEREARFTRLVHDTVSRGGRCLIPVFALGRAQELLLILDEYWQAHSDLHSIPIYYASSLAKKCMAVYQTYINMMNDHIRRQFKEKSNPFIFKHISNLRSIEHFDDVGPCVMMASPGMLQSGLSRELLELWAVDKRNSVIIPGYVVEGTLAKLILSEPSTITSMTGATIPLRLSVHYISFSAHVDYVQNSEFISEINAPHLVLVHGDANEMFRLKSALISKFNDEEDEEIEVEETVKTTDSTGQITLQRTKKLTRIARKEKKIWTPRNCETVELYFRGEKLAKTIGSLASTPPKHNATLSGLLVQKDYQYHILSPEDITEFTELKTVELKQRLKFPVNGIPFDLIIWGCQNLWGNVRVIESESDSNSNSQIQQVLVYETVTLKYERKPNTSNGMVVLEWEGDTVNDFVADSIVAVITGLVGSPAAVKATYSPCSHSHGGHGHDHSSEMVMVNGCEEPVEGYIPIRPTPSGSKEGEEKEEEGMIKPDMGFAWMVTEFLNTQFGVQGFGSDNEETESEALPAVYKGFESSHYEWNLKLESHSEPVIIKISSPDVTVSVEADSELLKRRVATVLERVVKTVVPVAKTFVLNGDDEVEEVVEESSGL